jgi:hypothetical protein
LSASGIGLTIAKALVEGMGGHIRAESAGSGHGSTFAFTLPCGMIGFLDQNIAQQWLELNQPGSVTGHSQQEAFAGRQAGVRVTAPLVAGVSVSES